MTIARKYATFAVALAVLVAGYINISRVYATQCDTCGNEHFLSATAEKNNSTSSASTNSNSTGNGATLGVGASNTDSSQNSSTESNIQTGVTQDTLTTSDATGAISQENKYGLQYETISTLCTQLSNQYSASITNLVNFTNSLSVKEQTVATQILGIAELQAADIDSALEALDESQAQSGTRTFFLGPDYGKLKIAKQVWQRNQLRIQELNQIKEQLSNSADTTNLETQITTLEQQNESLSNTLISQTKVFSLFGWVNKLFNKY